MNKGGFLTMKHAKKFCCWLLVIMCLLILIPAGNAYAKGISGNSNSDEKIMETILEKLGEPLYSTTYKYLSDGKVISNPEISDCSKALQTLLVGLGQSLTVDGNAGDQTFAAVHNAQKVLGKQQSDTVDASLFEELLKCLYIVRQEKAADEQKMSRSEEEENNILLKTMDSQKYEYLAGLAFWIRGEFYDASVHFAICGRDDADALVNACIQPWPGTGLLYQNPNYVSQDMHLIIQVDSRDPEYAGLYKIIAQNGDTAANLFIAGANAADVWLPGGIYMIKEATGKNWYGGRDLFGEKGSYETMLFYEFEGQDELTLLDSGYEWIISVNISQANPEGSNVGSQWTDYGSF